MFFGDPPVRSVPSRSAAMEFEISGPLSRAELAETELGNMPHDVAKVLGLWLHEQHGVTSSHHGVGSFLDELAAAGYRVTAIDPGPPIEELLPPATD